jgi:hypothetical protein
VYSFNFVINFRVFASKSDVSARPTQPDIFRITALLGLDVYWTGLGYRMQDMIELTDVYWTGLGYSMQDMIELTALTEGMEVCQEMLKRIYRPALEAKRDMRRCRERERWRDHRDITQKWDGEVGELH